MAELFLEMNKIDTTVDISDTTREKVNNKAALLDFLKTHCVQRQYSRSPIIRTRRGP